MGRLSINPAGMYGTARAFQDAEASDQRRQAFDLDQSIRRTQLENEQENQPLRRRALELGVQDAEETLDRKRARAPKEDELLDLGVDVARMNRDERKQALTDLTTARTNREHVTKALQESMASGQPQPFADALAKINPKFEGTTATRNEDGSITLSGQSGQPITFRAGKFPDGSEMSPDQAMAVFASKYLDPVGWVQNDYQQKYGIAKEQLKGQKAIEVANIRARGQQDAAGAKREEGWYKYQSSQIKPVLDSILKTQGVAGSFIAGYAHENDAALRALMEERMDEEVSNGVTARKAARKVVDDVRGSYELLNTKAGEYGKALAAKRINPRDPQAVQAAAQKGDVDALGLAKVISVANNTLGPSVGKYLISNLPNK